jgi:4-hydroxy-4-methyl-2-oxoglutarate aldolase
VLADEVGVCFIPYARAAEVLERTRRIVANEEIRVAKIVAGAPVAELLPKKK